MATDNEEAVLGLARCLVRALDDWGCPHYVRELLNDLKFQIKELNDERRSMNKGTWRHKEPKHYIVPEENEMDEPIKIVELVSVVKATEPKKVFQRDLDVAPRTVEGFLIHLGVSVCQRRVGRLILAGLSNFAIASVLGNTEKTIKHHVAAVFKAAGVSTRSEFCATVFGYDAAIASKYNDADPDPHFALHFGMRKYKNKNEEVELGI